METAAATAMRVCANACARRVAGARSLWSVRTSTSSSHTPPVSPESHSNCQRRQSLSARRAGGPPMRSSQRLRPHPATSVSSGARDLRPAPACATVVVTDRAALVPPQGPFHGYCIVSSDDEPRGWSAIRGGETIFVCLKIVIV